VKKQTKVSIGIQARSTSTRFPNKITQMIGSRMVIEHVIDSCRSCADYVNRYTFTNNIFVNVFLLIPVGDPIKQILSPMSDYIIEGAENDVLSRYVKMAKDTEADYIVRVTADCPMLPHFVIYKCINTAIKNGLDYTSNVGDKDETMRTAIDGDDVEVMSMRALEWADKNSRNDHDREHVTSVLRDDDSPPFFRYGVMIGHKDHSNIKLSIDSEQDLENVREEVERIQSKIGAAKKRYGKTAVFRF
jgi:spore coat polysaccharide biosynthesis protein SpsF